MKTCTSHCLELLVQNILWTKGCRRQKYLQGPYRWPTAGLKQGASSWSISAIGAAGRKQANIVLLDFICTLSLWKHIWTHFPDLNHLQAASMAEWKCSLTSSYPLSLTDRNLVFKGRNYEKYLLQASTYIDKRPVLGFKTFVSVP